MASEGAGRALTRHDIIREVIFQERERVGLRSREVIIQDKLRRGLGLLRTQGAEGGDGGIGGPYLDSRQSK